MGFENSSPFPNAKPESTESNEVFHQQRAAGAESPVDSRETLPPQKILKYVAEIGNDLSNYANTAIAMFAEAEDEGIEIKLPTSGWALKEFAPGGEYEKLLIELRARLLDISADLNRSGVRMTYEDVNARLDGLS